MNRLLFGSLLFVFAYADEPPDQNPGKFGQQYEGDMIFTDMSGLNSGSHAFRGNEKWIWPDGNVYYRLASTIKADQTRSSMIREAMDDITRDAPCVNFIDIEKEGASIAAFVDIVTHGDAELKVSALGCHSEVGYQGRRQILNLQPADCFNIATIKHELLHTLGCVHEHSRPDVAEALEILVENIHPNMRKNFEVEKYDDEDIHKGVYDYKTPYDIMSIMQYPANAFAFNDSLKTMKSKDPAFEGIFGYSEDFSAIDIVELNLRYNCTLNTPLVFDYVNEYLDIIISRRRMDQYAIAKLEVQSKNDNAKISYLEDQIVKLDDQSKFDQQKISQMEDQIKIDQQRMTQLEDQFKIYQQKTGGQISTLENGVSVNEGKISTLENDGSVIGGKISALEDDVSSLEMKSSFCGYHTIWYNNKNGRVITYQKLLVNDNNIPGASFSISSGQFTAGRTGVYNVQFSIGCIGASVSDKFTRIFLRLNGVNIEESRMLQSTPKSGHYDMGGRSMLVNMASGDKLEAYGDEISAVYRITFCVSLTK